MMNIKKYIPVWSKPGEISLNGCWVIIDTETKTSGWMYIHDYWIGVLAQLCFEWRNDKHIVGY